MSQKRRNLFCTVFYPFDLALLFDLSSSHRLAHLSALKTQKETNEEQQASPQANGTNEQQTDLAARQASHSFAARWQRRTWYMKARITLRGLALAPPFPVVRNHTILFAAF